MTAAEVRARRVALGLSQGALAKRAGVYRDSVSNMEVGKYRSRDTTMQAVLQALAEVEAERGVAPAVPTPAVTPVATPGVIRITVQGMYGDKNMSVEAPAANLPMLEALVDRIMANLAADT